MFNRPMNSFFEESYFNNTVEHYLTTLAMMAIGWTLVRIAKGIFLKKLKRWAEKTESKQDDIFISGMERFVVPLINFGIFYYSLNYLTWSPKMERAISYVTITVTTYFVIRLVTSSLQKMLLTYLRGQENGEQKVKEVGGIAFVINAIIWSVGIIFLFNNLGYNVTAILTGLGVGGIAVALAAQNILGDLFNYFVIFFDQPFEIGDFIIVDDKMGVVDHIGIKTTRIQCLSGEQLVISNTDLTKSRIHNFKRMKRRRVVFHLGLVYQTSLEGLKVVPGLIKQIIEEQANTIFDRAHFSDYGNFSLNFEIVYYIESSDYNLYMDIQQAINLRLLEEFQKRKIQFAYPTQTILFDKNGTS